MRVHTPSGSHSALSVLVLSVLSAGLACHATPSLSPWDEILIKHKWDAVPDDWVSLGQPPNGTTIKFYIALKANHENALIDALHEVSHPRHPKYVLFTSTPQHGAYSRLRFRYGMHLSKEQVAELVAPHPDTLDLVYSWLKYNGVLHSSISTTHGGSWLTVAGVPISQANKILGASYELYYHAWTNETIIRTVSYALPAALHMHVKTIAPTTAFTSTRLLQTQLDHPGGGAALANATSGEPSHVLPPRFHSRSYVTPSFLRWLYSMPLNNPDPTVRNKLGISGLANEFPVQADLRSFIQRFRNDVDLETASTGIVTPVPVNSGVDSWTFRARRANQDTQYSVALTYPTPIQYYTIGDFQQDPSYGPPMANDQYLEWLHYMINLVDVPQTISVPYFTRELDVSKEYANSVCDAFKVLGARGVSILVASGDQGVGRSVRRRMDGVLFSASFPASCTCDALSLLARCTHILEPGLGISRSPNCHNFAGPYVTSVGGTMGFDPEVGSEFSGGGFSTYFGRPDYQDDAVIPFLDSIGSQHAGLYEYVRSRGLTQLIFTMSFGQTSGPRRP